MADDGTVELRNSRGAGFVLIDPVGEGKHDTLVLANVDFAMLERQRLALTRVLNAAVRGQMAPRLDMKLVQGIQEMLDHWSDGRLAQKEGGDE